MTSSFALIFNPPLALVSLGVGLIGVALARWVFVNREARRLRRRERWHETLPLTLVAMLVAGVIIHDRQLGVSAAAFTGLGVGWAAVLLLDLLGERVVAVLRASFSAGPARPHDFPPQADLSGNDGMIDSAIADPDPHMEELLREADRLDKEKNR
jgi:H+/Cl- antiporter ClcA